MHLQRERQVDFDRDDANIGHLALHVVEPFEAEDVFYGRCFGRPHTWLMGRNAVTSSVAPARAPS